MIKMFLIYFGELKEWNQKIRLTSLKDDKTIIINHFVDSLSLIPHLPSAGCLLDLGSGAGFPGLPIKIVRPGLKVTLLESKRKKVSFLKHVITMLKLSDILTFHGRAEHFISGNGMPPRFGIITARAFAKFDKLLMLAQPLLEEGGCLVAMKGKEGEAEIKESNQTIKALSLEVIKTVNIHLPDSNKKRYLFFIMKQ
jgi:16S rRNA (guanine527-N7)-methyltransferase